MAYEPKTWECGEVVTADALNNMEQGIADAYELPSVTSADNGKVLGVDDGEYALVEQSGGASLVTLVLTSSPTDIVSNDTIIAPVDLPSGGIPLNKIKSVFVMPSTTDVGAMLTRYGGSADTAFRLNARLYNPNAFSATQVTATFYVTYEE